MTKFSKTQSGFTLLELMIVVSIIGVLANVALPAYKDYTLRARLTEMVLRLDNIADRVRLYRQETGIYPADTHIIPPAKVGIPDEVWYKDTMLGGNFNWEGPDNYPYAGISIFGATAPEEDIRIFDKIVDNGDLTSGIFRETPNGRYTYIIEE